MRSRWITAIIVIICIIFLWRIGISEEKVTGCVLFKKYKDERIYNNIRIIIESKKRRYKLGESITIKLSAINNSGRPFVYSTGNGSNGTDAIKIKGVPAYDLIFVGYVVDRSGNKTDYHWAWSKNTDNSNIAKISLAPQERKVLIEVTWKQARVRYIQGGFKAKFADFEFPTGIGIEPPKR